MNSAGVQILKALRGFEWLKSQTIGARRWDDVVDGTAPETRTVNVAHTEGYGGPAEDFRTVPYVSQGELKEIIELATKHGAKLDRQLVADALA